MELVIQRNWQRKISGNSNCSTVCRQLVILEVSRGEEVLGLALSTDGLNYKKYSF